ncbi:uncharacterized [Tachysurus ichikawai]
MFRDKWMSTSTITEFITDTDSIGKALLILKLETFSIKGLILFGLNVRSHLVGLVVNRLIPSPLSCPELLLDWSGRVGGWMNDDGLALFLSWRNVRRPQRDLQVCGSAAGAGKLDTGLFD